MVILNKIEIPSLIIHTEFLYHDSIKKNLLDKINQDPTKQTYVINEQFYDKMRTDWHKSKNNNSEWCKDFYPLLQKQLNNNVQHLGFEHAGINNLWFQQYDALTGTHGWHNHADNYTGVYYLEYAEDNPKTEFLYPSNLEKGFSIKVKEGDFIIFPCHIIHRSGINTSSKRKSIISFNLLLENILKKNTDPNFKNIIKTY
jgi:uncharacterized RmlC-like cupin family protein